MASEAEAAEFLAFFDRLMMDRDSSVLIPFFLGLAATITPRTDADQEDQDQENPDQENPERQTPLDHRTIFINPFTRTMVVIEGGSSLDSMLSDMGNKGGQPPASKASIEAMPCVKIGEGDSGCDCVICLEKFEVDGVAKEMPCKHRFHGDCIEKWLGIHGSCPVCRYKMPVDEEGLSKKSDNEGAERAVDGEIGVSFFVNNNRRTSED